MSADVSESDIPTPETVIKKSLVRAPEWLRRTALNALGVVTWVGLPSTVLSTLRDLHWVIDGALWLYQHAGAVKPGLLAAGQAVALVVEVWRAVTHPIWHLLAEWLHITLPAWAPDVLTLGLLVLAGSLRRIWRVAWGLSLSGNLMRRDFGSRSHVAIPEAFPYAKYFADTGDTLKGAGLRDTERLWVKWRKQQLEAARYFHTERALLFDPDVTRAQFGRYWLGIMDGRREMAVYLAVAVFLLACLTIDAALRLGLLR